ncbi:DUF2269 domain-containing protein [Rhodopseudomonas boonkerdii]|uniref:DUF2269 family protein n=1 Tax=Rhodopseudomonas boonkerdii TaxID=475937 RepID=UPI001E658A06|nr:DUF2269 domain-containing protein [Rhodopseudomonas boonkerdii]UGV24582.1 DUF2269 domain-containing protein [Rhodopseudomonas boonkerdii]
MTVYLFLKFLHVLGAVVILGTGGGVAFMMLQAHRSGDGAFVAATANTSLAATALLTGGAMVLQPFTGGLLMEMSSTSATEPWMIASLILYALASLLWLPVLFMQIEIRTLTRTAMADRAPLPLRYHILFRRSLVLGTLVFGAMLITLWLMIAKP